jgi:hypothetical protein
MLSARRGDCSLALVVGGVELQHHAALDLLQPAPVRVEVDLERARDFLVAGLAAELVLQVGLRRAQQPAAHAHRARHPVARAQFVQHGAADARHGVGAERQPAPGVEALERLHQPQRAGADQVVDLDVARDAAGQLVGAVVHESEVAVEQLRARVRVPVRR